MTMTKKAKNLTACLVGLITGSVGVFAYSPFDYWFVSFLSAAGLIWLATRTERKIAYLGVFIWAVSYFAIGVNWVQVSMIQFGGVPEIVSYLVVLLLASYLALYPLLFAVAIRSIRNPWFLAATFTATEYLRGVVFTGFPWLQFGYSLIDSPFHGLAPLFGVEGLTFFVMLVSGYGIQLIEGVAKKQSILTACIALPMLLLSAFASQFLTFVQPNNSQTPLKVSLVQGNIEQKMKWDPAHFDYSIRTYERLILPLLGKSDVIILPESALPAFEAHIEPLLQQLQQLGQEKGSELIIGTLYQNDRGLFNSAVVVGNPQQPYSLENAPRFNKHHLVPFGEYVPFGSLLDWMREVFVLPINLSQGAFIQSPLTVKGKRFNTAICYEIIFTDQVQKNQQAHQADYLLTISNDAWFGESIGPWQHFQMARMRALELGKPLLRATNTGITAVVNAHGRVTEQLPQFESAVLTTTVPMIEGKTLFARFGNLWLYLFSGLIWLIGMATRLKKRANRA
ncbi:apolipoprotein N-acyltransferase [Pasteurellaceae bacterium Macca]|nr:apolipoprotein N-acyltransferase [Pasteurellaceae bacterium Macca]